MDPARSGRPVSLRDLRNALVAGLLGTTLATAANAESRIVSVLPGAAGSGSVVEFGGDDGARLLPARVHGNETALVAVNMNGAPRRFEIPEVFPGDGYAALAAGSTPAAMEGDGSSWEIAPMSVGIVPAR
jgi:hypothetical protein